METGFEWIAELKDGTSKPAKAIKEALKAIKGQIVETEKEMLRLQEAQAMAKRAGFAGTAKEIGGEISSLRLKIKGLSLQHKELSGLTEKSKESMFGAVLGAGLWVEAIKKIGEVAIEAAKKLAEFVLEGAKMAIEAREFRNDMTDAYAAFRGSAEEGESTYKMIDQLARSLPIPARQAHEMAKDLMVQGLENQAQIANTIKAVASLTEVQGEAAGGKLQNIINRSLASGKFTIKTKELTAVGGQALQGFYANLSKRLKIGVAEVKERLAAGQIDVSQGIDAITETINEGKIGELSAKQMGDFSVQTKKLKDNFMRLFDGIKTEEFLQQMGALLSVFDENTASGKVLKSVLTDTFNFLFEIGTEAIRSIYHGFLYVELYGLKALNAIGPFLLWFQKVNDQIHILDRLKEVLLSISNIIMPLGLEGVGKAIGSGLEVGMNAASGDVKGAAKALGQGALDTLKAALQIHSPSAEMAKLGRFTSEGFASGVESGEGRTQGALASVARPPQLETGGGTSGGQTITINVGGVEIQGVHGVEQMGPMLETWFTDLLERVALEAGS